jgi:beta-lactamase regulating signal transducer with metallopeptidase domain
MWNNINEILKLLAVMTITGSIIAAALFALKPILRNRLPKTAQYYLWLVALAAFLVPFSTFVILPKTTEATIPTAPIYTVVEPYMLVGAPSTANDPDSPKHEGAPPIEYPLSVKVKLTIAQWKWIVLPIGALSTLLCHILAYALFLRKIRRHNALTDIDCAIPVYRNAKAQTPMLIGLFRPAIILPDAEYTDEQLYAVLLHELTHLRRKDVLVKWLSVVACAVHWFNPIVWFVRREIDRACELSCDEAVIRSLDTADRQNYGDTLIYVAADTKTPRAVLSTTMCEDKKDLKERLIAIMKNKKSTRLALICSVALVILLAVCAAILGAGSGRAENKIFFAPGERKEIVRFAAIGSSDYANITVKFAKTSGLTEFLLSAEQNGAEIDQKTIGIGESVTFTVSGYLETVIYAKSDENSLSNNVIFEAAQSSNARSETTPPAYDTSFVFQSEISVKTSPDRYALTMSSTPGIILSIAGQAEGLTTLKYEAASGSFGLWEDGVITGLGNPANRKFGDPPSAHWTPDNATQNGDTVTVSLLSERGDVLAQINMAVSVQDNWYSLIPTSKSPAQSSNASGGSIYDLTAKEALQISSSSIADYYLYTNSEKITVSVPDVDFEVKIMLYLAKENALAAQFELGYGTKSNTFTNLTSARTYYIEAEAEQDIEITVTD